MSGNDWVKPGAKVVIIRPGGWHHNHIVGESVVAKVGKRDVVLANDRRYRLSDLHEQGRDRYYASWIVAADDPKVAQIEQAKAEQDRMNDARRAVDEWESRRTLDNTRAAIAALTAVLADQEAEAEAEAEDDDA